MKDEGSKQVDYTGFMGEDKLRIAHEYGSLEYVPDKSQVDLTDNLARHNLRKQIRKRKRIMAGLDYEIKDLEKLLDKEV